MNPSLLVRGLLVGAVAASPLVAGALPTSPLVDPYADIIYTRGVPRSGGGSATPRPAARAYRPGPRPVHAVVPGDTLWGIAERYCGSGLEWKHIYEANRGQIKDPHWIFPGQDFQVACAPPTRPPPPKPPRPPAPPPGGGKPPPGPPMHGNGIHRVHPHALSFARGLPIDPGDYRVVGMGTPGSGGLPGVMLETRPNAPVRSVTDGVVTRVGNMGAAGWTIFVMHPSGFEMRYSHLGGRPALGEGDRVQAGQPLGVGGDSGQVPSGKSWLYFEVVNASGRPVDLREVLIF